MSKTVGAEFNTGTKPKRGRELSGSLGWSLSSFLAASWMKSSRALLQLAMTKAMPLCFQLSKLTICLLIVSWYLGFIFSRGQSPVYRYTYLKMTLTNARVLQ